MSAHRTARERHLAAEDARNMVHLLHKYEDQLRTRAVKRIVGPLVQEPHRYAAPVPRRYLPTRGDNYLDPPGHMDSTGFAPGCIV